MSTRYIILVAEIHYQQQVPVATVDVVSEPKEWSELIKTYKESTVVAPQAL